MSGKLDPNYRTVTLKLPRWMVVRVLVALSAMISSDMLRPRWSIRVHDEIEDQLQKHDDKVKEVL